MDLPWHIPKNADPARQVYQPAAHGGGRAEHRQGHCAGRPCRSEHLFYGDVELSIGKTHGKAMENPWKTMEKHGKAMETSDFPWTILWSSVN